MEIDTTDARATADDDRTSTIRPHPPSGTIDELLDALTVTRDWDKEFGDFNPDTFEMDAACHVTKYGINKHGAIAGAGVTNQAKQPVVLEQVALFKDVFFFVNPFTNKVTSVSTEAMRDEMVRRGFRQILVDHITDPSCLPDPPRQEVPDVTRLCDRLPPSTLKLPRGGGKNFVPKLCFKTDDETHATAVVRAYEEKVVDETKNEVCSPIRMWSTNALKNHNLGGDSKLTQRRKAYWTIKKMRLPPSAINLKQSEIFSKCNEIKIQAQIPKPDWEKLAADEYNNRSGGHLVIENINRTGGRVANV